MLVRGRTVEVSLSVMLLEDHLVELAEADYFRISRTFIRTVVCCLSLVSLALLILSISSTYIFTHGIKPPPKEEEEEEYKNETEMERIMDGICCLLLHWSW